MFKGSSSTRQGRGFFPRPSSDGLFYATVSPISRHACPKYLNPFRVPAREELCHRLAQTDPAGPPAGFNCQTKEAASFLQTESDCIRRQKIYRRVMRSLAGPLHNWLATGLGFFYPEICQLCESERATAKDGFVGAQCWTQVRFIRPPFCERCGLPYPGDLTTAFECTNCRELELHFSSARSAVVAKSVVLEAIHRFKYSHALWFENFLADLLVREAAPELKKETWD